MPRFKKLPSKLFENRPLSSNPAELAILVREHLDVIDSELAKINDDFMTIIDNHAITALNIRHIQYKRRPDAEAKIKGLCTTDAIDRSDTTTTFLDNETIVPEGAKYPIMRAMHNRICKQIRNFMKSLLNHLLACSDILPEIHRIWEVLRIYRKVYFALFETENVRQISSHVHPQTNVLISKLFYEIVYPSIYVYATNALCNEFDIMRETQTINRDYVRVMALFTKHYKRLVWYSYSSAYEGLVPLNDQYYSNHFENVYLKRLETYYAVETDKWIRTGNVLDYCNYVKKAQMFERDLCDAYMPNRHPEESIIMNKYEGLIGEAKRSYEIQVLHNKKPRITLFKAETILDKILAIAKSDYILSSPSGLESMFASENAEGTKLIIDVLSQRHDLIIPIYKNYLAKQMDNILKSVTEPEFISTLSKFNQQSVDFIVDILGNVTNYRKVLSDVMSAGINSNETIVEQIVVAIDNIIQGKGEKLSESEQENRLLAVLEWFRYIYDKDVFAETYRQYMAKRLINQKSSIDLERFVMVKLKAEAGVSFTSKMENMISDVSNSSSSTYSAEFCEYSKALSLPALDFSPLVLTTSAWPTFANIRANLPSIMESYVQAFKQFYELKHDHRRLTITLGGGTVTVEFGKFEIQMIPLQAVVLMVFNDVGNVSIEKVVELTGIDVDTARYMLHSLSCGKYKLLKKTPESGTISATDIFVANWEFTTPMRRFRMPVPNLNQPVVNRAKITEDRTYAIEAAIVRIMKSRKVVTHNELIGKVLEQMNMFKPDPKTIKARIENLIGREYMERDETVPGVYKYVA